MGCCGGLGACALGWQGTCAASMFLAGATCARAVLTAARALLPDGESALGFRIEVPGVPQSCLQPSWVHGASVHGGDSCEVQLLQQPCVKQGVRLPL